MKLAAEMKKNITTEAWNASVVNSPAHRRTVNGEDERFWERCTDAYVRNRTSGAHFSRVVKWLLDKVRNASLIEIGPGPGIFTRFLMEHCTQVTAVEPSPANAAWLMREMSGCCNLKVRKEKWEDVAVAPHDVVFAAGTLYVFRDIEAAITKMRCHARSKVLLVTMNDEQEFEKGVAADLGLPLPEPSGLSTALFLDVLRSLGLSFNCESFSDELEYQYPDIDVLADLWKGSLGLREEHLSDLEALFRKRGLYTGNQTAIRVPRRFTTVMVEIPVNEVLPFVTHCHL
jgi:hypothetical protein